MTKQSEFEQEIAQLLVTSLELDDVAAAEIVPDAPLFGSEPDSLGLDSIDALEIALAVNQAYGIELRADDKANSRIFATLGSLAAYVDRART
jgi:acyl carrier protein